jgi:hypothetical protein
LTDGYKSPIEVITQGVQMTIEDGVYKAVENYGINVDKDELLKALQYDRKQYQKGFADGIKAVAKILKESMCNYDLDNYHSFRAIEEETLDDIIKEYE